MKKHSIVSVDVYFRWFCFYVREREIRADPATKGLGNRREKKKKLRRSQPYQRRGYRPIWRVRGRSSLDFWRYHLDVEDGTHGLINTIKVNSLVDESLNEDIEEEKVDMDTSIEERHILSVQIHHYEWFGFCVRERDKRRSSYKRAKKQMSA